MHTGKGIAKFSRQNMFKETSGIGVEMTDRVFRLQPCHGMLPGLGMLQNLPSAVVAHVLAPVPGSQVLDMCASPGGVYSAIQQQYSEFNSSILDDSNKLYNSGICKRKQNMSNCAVILCRLELRDVSRGEFCGVMATCCHSCVHSFTMCLVS